MSYSSTLDPEPYGLYLPVHHQVSDRLRELLLNPEAECGELVGEADKAEFLWQCFEHICLGGACCQYEVGGGGEGHAASTR